MLFSAVPSSSSSSFAIRISTKRAWRNVGTTTTTRVRVENNYATFSSKHNNHKPSFRSFVSSCKLNINDTPLGTEKGKALLDGLDVYSVAAKGDEHPLSVYGIDLPENSSEEEEEQEENNNPDNRHILLLLHGRTWSSVPVYHLLGGPECREKGLESRSFMETLVANNIQPYALDFRGFGGTPKDDKDYVEPNRCVEDAESVLEWIRKRHGPNVEISLLGWSQGALVAQLAAQRKDPIFSKVVLYGSLYDPSIRYPREPLYIRNTVNHVDVPNTFDNAVEDFTIEGTIPPEMAVLFAEAALTSDPIKRHWKHLHQFNNCDPARIHSPTLIISGDQDPYAPLPVQQELFANLGRGSDRTMSILADSDHAVHLLEGRNRFADVVISFLHNGKKSAKVMK